LKLETDYSNFHRANHQKEQTTKNSHISREILNENC